MIFPHLIFKLLIKSITVFIPSMTVIMIIKSFSRIIPLNYSWSNTGICINNTLFIWYITSDSRYFTIFNWLYINPRTLCCKNTNNLWCNSKFYKTNNLDTRKWIFLMAKINVTISDVFAFPDKLITIKWTIIFIKTGVLSPEQVFE